MRTTIAGPGTVPATTTAPAPETDLGSPWRLQAYDRVERAMNVPLLILSLAMIPILVLPIVVHLSHDWIQTLDVIDLAIWAVFSLDYLTLLALSIDRWRYIRTHVVDLMLVALPLLRPLRVIRSVRALRVLRLARLGTVSTQGIRLSRHRLACKGPAYALGVAVILTLASAALVLDAERTRGNIHTFGDAVWWAMTTVTTVGYGDHYPVTALGRVVAVALMLVGIAVLGIITAALAAWLVKVNGEQEQDTDQQQIMNRLHDLEALISDLRADLLRAQAERDTDSSNARLGQSQELQSA
jgi:voltage-gated potassium channel